MDKQDFINRVKLVAIEGFYEYNALPSLCIAQACLESAFGKHHMGKANNYFGFKASKSWKGKKVLLPTKEWNGKEMVTVYSYFRAYDSLEDSIRDYLRLIGTAARYANVLKAKDYLAATVEVWKAGYASDPKYPEKLQNIIEEYKLYNIDKEVLKNMENKNEISIWAKKAQEWVKENNISDGTRPKDAVTREEVWTMLYRLRK